MTSQESDFADDIASALKDAGWKIFRNLMRSTRERGVEIGTTEGMTVLDEKRVSDALTAIGIPHKRVAFHLNDNSTPIGFERGALYLVVNHHPEPTSTHRPK